MSLRRGPHVITHSQRSTDGRHKPRQRDTPTPFGRSRRSAGPSPAGRSTAGTRGSGLPAHRRRPIAGLKEHDWQDRLYHDLEGGEFERLVDSLRREGQRDPIQITPDGTIIDGHQRVRAAHQLGWVEICAWVRDDLAGNQDAIDRAHIAANRDRRQLDLLSQVRLARRQAELDKGRRVVGFSKEECEELRDRVGELVGFSGRHAQRYLNVLYTPMGIQRAVSNGEIGLVMADKISRLKWATQEKIAQEVEKGDDPDEVVARHVTTRGRGVKPNTLYRKMVSAVAEFLDALNGRHRELRPVYGSEEDLELMDRLARFRDELAEDERRRRAEFQQVLEENPELAALYQTAVEAAAVLS